MRGVLIALSLIGTPALAAPSPGSLSLKGLATGQATYVKWCVACHAAGSEQPGTAALAAKYGKEKPAALLERRDLTPEVVKYFVRNGVSVMPPFRKTEISDAELDAVARYLAKSK